MPILLSCISVISRCIPSVFSTFAEHKSREFILFVDKDIIASGIRVLSLPPEHCTKITGAADRFHLDFDDAYQYAVAEQYGLSIVSFDKDFDRTEKGRMEPQDLFP